MRAGASLAAVLLTAVQTAAAAGPPAASPAEWLLQVGDAARHGTYQGTLVYRDDQDRLETLRVVHRFKDGRVQERITSLTGKQRDVFRENDRIVSVVAEEPQQVYNGPDQLLPSLSAGLLQKLAAHYELRDLGTARVAGRATRGVAIAPRDEYRYGHSVYADLDSRVPLLISLTDAEGRVIEQMMFTSIELDPRIPDAIFNLPPATPGLAPVPAATAVSAEAAEPARWLLEQLPPGFAVTQRSTQHSGEGRVDHILLSDGLSAVSVFGTQSREPEGGFSGYSKLGAMNVYGRQLGEYHVTVIGEVPQATVRLIGDGVTLATADGPTAAP